MVDNLVPNSDEPDGATSSAPHLPPPTPEVAPPGSSELGTRLSTMLWMKTEVQNSGDNVSHVLPSAYFESNRHLPRPISSMHALEVYADAN